ncbi:hypothetical protein D9757_001282 [Collybiopsis confluens]|uniref:INO80 complex subunit F domain-containing protein n=1 Tax=Collybiopsis confluens TaxID=2823264 RepID=A0A8H5I113_9AGAR|nr:hypothetical protein D9757_001282 [Collybiopsis confluens]
MSKLGHGSSSLFLETATMASGSPGPSAISARSKPKQAVHTMGITAGAEDVKYHAKYKELKRKVKEVEADNDKLHFKVLNAKRNIQRMKLERAILYERLGQISTSPTNDRHPPPPAHHHPAAADSAVVEPDPNFIEYAHSHSRTTPARALPAIDTSVGPHSIPPLHRRGSGNASDSRQLPSFNQLPPMLDQPPPSPHSHHHLESHERTRSHSSSRSRNVLPQQSSYHHGPHPPQYPDSYPPVHHSPPLSEREREGSRSRRHDLHELAGTHEGHGHPMGPISPTADARPRSIHNHQRLGPAYVNRDEWEQDRERELNYRQRDRDPNGGPTQHSPPSLHRSRAPSGMDYPEQQHHIPSSRAREEYYRDPSSGPSGGAYSHARVSRSGTPGSGSGSTSAGGGGGGGGANDIPSRPDSRGGGGGGGYFDERSTRSYKFRHVNAGREEGVLDFVHEDGRSQPRDRGAGGLSGGGSGSGSSSGFQAPAGDPSVRRGSRKSSREMDLDAEMD